MSALILHPLYKSFVVVLEDIIFLIWDVKSWLLLIWCYCFISNSIQVRQVDSSWWCFSTLCLSSPFFLVLSFFFDWYLPYMYNYILIRIKIYKKITNQPTFTMVFQLRQSKKRGYHMNQTNSKLCMLWYLIGLTKS